jgi:hypothetical protein
MKNYLEKFDAILHSFPTPVNDNNLNDGDLTPHYNKVRLVEILRREFDENGVPTGRLTAFGISVDDLREILKEVDELESVHFEDKFTTLPF